MYHLSWALRINPHLARFPDGLDDDFVAEDQAPTSFCPAADRQHIDIRERFA
jgi:hypothetical protein